MINLSILTTLFSGYCMDIVGRTYIWINSYAYWRKCCNFVLFSFINVYSDGDVYEGDWVNDLRQGHGIMKFVDGTIYGVSKKKFFPLPVVEIFIIVKKNSNKCCSWWNAMDKRKITKKNPLFLPWLNASFDQKNRMNELCFRICSQSFHYGLKSE